MGMSLYINCASKEKLEKMQSFIQANFSTYDEIIKDSENLKIARTRSESYAPHSDYVGEGSEKTILGVKAPLGMNEMYYTFRVLTWMSLKVGRVYKFKDIKLPVVYIDGQKCPIHLDESNFASTPQDGGKYTVDNLGWAEMPEDPAFNPEGQSDSYKQYVSQAREGIKEISLLTKQELQRLEDLWQATKQF